MSEKIVTMPGVNPADDEFAPLVAAYHAILSGAQAVAASTPENLRTACFQEVLRHMLENERMQFLMSRSSTPATAPSGRIIAPGVR